MAIKKELLTADRLRKVSSPGQVVSEIDSKADSAAPTFQGDIVVQEGKIIAQYDGTSFRMRGAQHVDEGGEQVQSYAGIFAHAAYLNKGTLKTKIVYGANYEMDLEVQSPHALLLTAVDDTQADGKLVLSSKTAIYIDCRANAEVVSPKRLVIDRVDSGSTGSANTSDVTVKASSGSLYLNHGVTTGAVIFPSLTEVQRDALTPVVGMVVFNTDAGELQAYDGAWKALHA